MKSDLLNTKHLLPPCGRGLRWGVFVITILLPLILGIGCSGSGGGGKEEPPNTISRKLFVANLTGDRISIFDAEASGNVAPIRSIGSNIGLFDPQAISIDTVNNEIFVANINDTITVYRKTDEGDVTPLRTIIGLNTRLSRPVGISVDTKNNEIFVVNNSSNEITVYRRTDEGDVAPLRTIEGPNTGLFSPVGIFVDAKNNEIFVANQQLNKEILVYRRTDKGDVTPLRIISMSELTAEGLPILPTAIYVDTKNDEILVDNSVFRQPSLSGLFIEAVGADSIKVYRRTAEGNAPPLRTIRGANTGLDAPQGIFVDIKNDEILVANANNTVIVFGRTDTGDIPPLRTLSILDSNHAGAFCGIRFRLSGIFVDIGNNEIFVANRNDTITIYGSENEGNAPPLRIIGPHTGLLRPKWIYTDTENNEIFVSNPSPSVEEAVCHASDLITVYGISDEGNAAPLRTISQGGVSPEGISMDTKNNELFAANKVLQLGLSFSIITVIRRTGEGHIVPLRAIVGTNPGLSFPEDIYVDTKNNEIFVTINDTITVYGRTDNGDVPPLRTIEGPDTGLALPSGIFVDTKNNEIFVANSGNDTITVYGRTDDGDVSPLRTIGGSNTGLSVPGGIFVDVENNEIFVSNSGNNTITVYGRTDEGDVTPLRIIEGPNTGLDFPWGIFVAESP